MSKTNLPCILLVTAFAVLSGCSGGKKKTNATDENNIDSTGKVTVACYYFPNYHVGDARNDAQHGAGWSEWEVVKAARPVFDGNNQPKVPLWGYTDEKDPKVMELKIDAAASHGVNVFIYDWYYYDDGPFLNRGLDEGFLGASNNDRLKFALMWANHDWLDIHPYTKGNEQTILYHGRVKPETYDRICDTLIEKYFSKPNYWKIDGKPYLSIYDIQNFVENFGSVEAAAAAMDRLREKSIDAGLKGVHWNLVTWGKPILPNEKVTPNISVLLKRMKFDSATSYVWIHHIPLDSLQTDYNTARDRYFAIWDNMKKDYECPYIPNVTVGWDPSPRYVEKTADGLKNYLVSNTIGNNTPENFCAALQMTKERLLAEPGGLKILNINCWNEWTEGSCLEPDSVYGMGYLDALKQVFGEH